MTTALLADIKLLSRVVAGTNVADTYCAVFNINAHVGQLQQKDGRAYDTNADVEPRRCIRSVFRHAPFATRDGYMRDCDRRQISATEAYTDSRELPRSKLKPRVGSLQA
jgi:hypothetical protein